MAVRVLVAAGLLLFAPAVCWAGGWYLMLPPEEFVRDKSGKLTAQFNDRKPLRSWRLYSSHDTATACDRARSENLKGFIESKNKPAGPGFTTADVDAMIRAMLAAQCVATDDPRLKR